MSGRAWTDTERLYLAAHYGETPAAVIATRLGRTKTAVQSYATKHGLSRRRWTDEERQYLREHRENAALTAAHLGRSVSSVRGQRSFLGLTLPPRRAWTRGDDDYVRSHYPDEPTGDVARALGRAKTAVARRASDLSIKKSDAYLAALAERRHTEYKTHANPAKASATLRRLYRLERSRVMLGLPQKTRLRVSFETQRKRAYIKRMRQHGYILSADRHTLYYTPATSRRLRAEAHAGRYHMSVMERGGA